MFSDKPYFFFFFLMIRRPPRSTRRSSDLVINDRRDQVGFDLFYTSGITRGLPTGDRKSTRLNSSHMSISYAVFCLKKKKCGSHQGESRPVVLVALVILVFELMFVVASRSD